MNRPFVYGMAVDGENFTDRELETKRLKLNFENGVNSILISQRRIGKTSLVKHVMRLVDSELIKVVFMDIYKCRTEYDFYETFASAVIRGTATRMERMIDNAKEFLMGVTPKIVYSPEPNTDFGLSLGISERTNTAEEVLDLPERIARKCGIRIVVCIDEFQQIGEMSNALDVQKTIRSVWQHHQHTSYCLFGSKQHLLRNLFYGRKMPFYQFGDMFFLKRIEREKWIPFIIGRFCSVGKNITEELAGEICDTVENYPAYVQQLAWNVLAMSGDSVTTASFSDGLQATMQQVSPLFVEQTEGLTSYQLNMLRAIGQGYHNDFGKQEVTIRFNLGTRSNLVKLKKALIEREIVEETEQGLFIADPLFLLWFRKNMM